MLACSLAVGAMLFAAGKASADGGPSLLTTLNISGTITYVATNYTTASGIETKKTATMSFNTAKLIAMLNASTQFQTDLAAQGYTATSIPAKSYLIMDDSTGNVIVTNKTTKLSLNLSTLVVDYYGYTNVSGIYAEDGDSPIYYVSMSQSSFLTAFNKNAGDAEAQSGTHNTTTKAGTEKHIDATETMMITDGTVDVDGNPENVIVISGLTKNSGTYSAVYTTGQYAGLQRVSKSGSITGSGGGCYYLSADQDDYPYAAVTQGTGTASGSGYANPNDD